MQTSQENIETVRDYDVVRLTRENLHDLARLHAAVYSVPPPFDYYKKKYNTGFTGHEFVGLLAYNKERIPIAYYGVLPCFIEYQGKKILAAQSADTMTHPKFRFKGMFVELSKRCFELCRTLGIRLVFGFPNQNSYHGAVTKLGWKMTGSLDFFSIPVKGFPLEKMAEKFKFISPVYKNYRERILAKFTVPSNGCSNSVIADGYAGVNRSEEYLNYKTFSPTRVLQLAKARIWIGDKKGFVVGDMEGVGENNFSEVLNEIKKIASRLGIDQIQFHFSPGTSLHRLLAQEVRPEPSFPMLFQDFGSAIPPELVRFSFSDVDIF